MRVLAMRVLGIETSCDETAVALVDSQGGLLGQRVYSQTELHAEYGGVVPELASRDHIRKLLPLLRQVLPLDDEDRIVPGFGLDAVGDAAARAASGVIRKYRGRALLVATGSCAIHCRYCFRRHFPYAEETAAADGWSDAIALIASSLVFASLHLGRPFPGDQSVATFYRASLMTKYTLAGLPMGWLFWRWGLPYAIVCHAMVNATHIVLERFVF